MQIPYVLLLYLHQELKPLRDLVHRTSVQTQMVPMNSKVAKKSLCLGGSWLLSLTRRLLKSQARTSPAALYSKYSESLPKPEAPSHLLYNKCPLVSALLAVREPPSPPPQTLRRRPRITYSSAPACGQQTLSTGLMYLSLPVSVRWTQPVRHVGLERVISLTLEGWRFQICCPNWFTHWAQPVSHHIWAWTERCEHVTPLGSNQDWQSRSLSISPGCAYLRGEGRHSLDVALQPGTEKQQAPDHFPLGWKI